MWFDSHCHLYDCDHAPVDALIRRAHAVGVTRMLVAGVDAATSRSAAALTRFEGVVAAAGIHPTASAGWEPKWMDPIEDALRAPGVVAVGETGLDFDRDAAPRPSQERSFEAHVELAKASDRALVIHTRSSVDAALDVLMRRGAPARLVFHCWSGDAAQLERALGMGAHVSFAGNVTFKNASVLRDLVARVPDDRILVETDAPWLTPVPHRGKPNEPALVVHVGKAVAHARATSEDAVARLTSSNARRLFAIAG